MFQVSRTWQPCYLQNKPKFQLPTCRPRRASTYGVMLPTLDSGAGIGIKAGAGWSAQWKAHLSALEGLLDDFGSSDLPDDLSRLCGQIGKECRSLAEMLRAPTPAPRQKCADLTGLFRLLRRAGGLRVRGDAFSRDAVHRRLPRVWRAVAFLAERVLAACREDCLPFAREVVAFVLRATEEFSASFDDYGEARGASVRFRCSLLDLLRADVDTFGSASGAVESAGELVDALLRDVVPFKKQIRLETGKKGSKRAARSKKQRQRQQQQQPEEGDDASSFSSPGPVARRALGCLGVILNTCGELLPSEIHRKVACPLLAISLDLCRRNPSHVRAPAPFDDPGARLELWRCLLALCAHPSPRSPPPFHAVAGVFRSAEAAAAGAADPAAVAFLRSARDALQSVVRPRALSLDLPPPPHGRLERVAANADAMTKVHVHVLRDGGGAPSSAILDEAGPPPPSSRKRVLQEDGDGDDADGQKVRRQSPEEATGPAASAAADTAEEVVRVTKEYLDNRASSTSTKTTNGKSGKSVSVINVLKEFDATVAERKSLLDKFYDLSQEPIVVPEEAKHPPPPPPPPPRRSDIGSPDKRHAEEGGGDGGDDEDELNIDKIKAFFVMESSSSDEEPT